MTLCLHELKRKRWALAIWSAAVAFMLGICVLIYPDMSSQMGEIGDMFANMGSFTAAFGMDQLNFGEFKGYFGIECGNVLGLGGALFAALMGACALSGEEADRTAEFLLTHPIGRTRAVGEKLLAVLIQITTLNVAVVGVTLAAMAAIGEAGAIADVWLLLLAYYILQLEIAAVCFAISAFLRTNGAGVGLGLALSLYFLNIVSNLAKEAEPLKFITPFSFADSAYIIPNGKIEMKYLAVGLALTVAGVAVAFWQYNKKDIT